MNIPKLRAKVAEKNIKREELCKLWGLECVTSVSNKINGKTPITLDEAQRFADYAGLTDEEIVVIFFSKK